MSDVDLPIPFEAYDGEEPFIFISYAHKDAALVYPEIQALHEQGYRIWYDEGIDPGNEWPDQIARALGRCANFLVFITKNAVASKNVKNEINFALNRDKPFLAVHLEQLTLPEGLELRMGDIQAIMRWRIREDHYVRKIGKTLDPSLMAASIPRSAPGPVASSDAGAPSRTEVPSGMGNGPRPLYGAARRVALVGPGVLEELPFQRFGLHWSVDREEIENLQYLQELIQDYKETDAAHVYKPLSLAVFGPPGSGRLFGFKQIVKSIYGSYVPQLEFNLSRFNDPKDLFAAFHQVRDLVQGGATPVVFWDEFDSKDYMWLPYLLEPMQDGAFLEGPVSHPIGKCVFVFAGVTSWDFENFGPQEPDREFDHGRRFEKKREAWDRFRHLKGPDFIHRLSGYLNVMGPNPRCAWDPQTECWVPQVEDISFPVRRAILMRAMLGIRDREPLAMEPGLVAAILEIPRYKHGARSLGKILAHVRKGVGAGQITRSDLPKGFLKLHVDSEAFISIMEREDEFIEMADILAPAIHGFWYQLMKKNGWETDLPKSYEELPDAIKADNIAAARRIPAILALVGLSLRKKEDGSPEREGLVAGILEEHMELLAEAEHDGWMEYKLRNGWEFAETRDDDRRRHNRLIPYQSLPEKEKDKDRNSVRHFAVMAAMAGYQIVRNTYRA